MHNSPVWYVDATPSAQLRHHSPPWGAPGGQWWSEACLAGGAPSSAPSCSLCLLGEMADVQLENNSQLVAVWGLWFDLEGIWPGNRWQGGLEKRCVDRAIWMSKKLEDIVFHENAHQMGTPAEEDFNSQGDRMTHRADISQPLPASPAIAQWACEQMAMVAAIEVVHRLSSMDYYSPRSLGHSHCWESNLPAAENGNESLIRHHCLGWSTS